jgi:hypothetical protein
MILTMRQSEDCRGCRIIGVLLGAALDTGTMPDDGWATIFVYGFE